MSAEKPNAERLLRVGERVQLHGIISYISESDGAVGVKLDNAFTITVQPAALQPVPSAVGQPSLEKLRELEADLRNAKCEGPPEIVKATLEGMHHIADRLRAVLAEFEKEGK